MLGRRGGMWPIRSWRVGGIVRGAWVAWLHPATGSPWVKSRLRRCTLRCHVDLHVDGGRRGSAPAHQVEAGGSRATPARLTPGAPRALRRVAAQADTDPRPAGWGKSTLLADWHALESETRPFAWVALDGGDNDPVRFWTYLIHALHTLDPSAGEVSLPMLRAPRVSVVEDVLPALCNELTALPRQVVLVLDDYHLVTEPGDRRGSLLLSRAPSPNPRACALEPFRAGAPARAPTRPRRPRRDRRATTSLLRRGGRPLSQRPARARPRPCRRPPATRAHRGMAGGSLPCDAHHPRPGKRARVHRRVCGRQPPCRRLPELGGSGGASRGDEGLPPPHVRASTPLRPPLRRRHRPTGLGTNPARARAFELLPHPPRREARSGTATTSSSATYCATSSRSASRRMLARCIAGRAPGTESMAIRPRRSVTPRRQGTSPMPPS